MKKVLFLIHDLGQGGAEKVLVNLVNNMDLSKFDITVMSIFGGGVNEQFLRSEIHYITVFKKTLRGNSKLMKLMTPRQLHRWFIKEKYDVEISYLEGPSARIISGCPINNTKLVTWIHSNHFSMQQVVSPFRSKKEAIDCYTRFDKVVCVSQIMKDNFCSWMPVYSACEVLYNTVESDRISTASTEEAQEIVNDGVLNIVAVGTLKAVKGFDRLLRVLLRLKKDGYKIRLYLLGKGPMQETLEKYVRDNDLSEQVFFLGYQTNPYKFVSKCDLFVCSSHAEGFSTAATEALIVGTPVCTVEVSGMKEMLGDNNEYGLITENSEDALYVGLKSLISDPELLAYYKKQAAVRGKKFSTGNTVHAVEEMLLSL